MTRQSVRGWIVAATVAIAAVAVACGGSSTTPTAPSTPTGMAASPGGTTTPTTPTTPTTSTTGRFTLGMTDSPFSDADAVLVSFEGVSIHRSEGDGWETLDIGGTRVCDLKKLQGPTDVLGVAELPAGHYTQIRLTVAKATIYFGSGPSTGDACSAVAPTGGQSYPVDIPSGQVKLNRQFTLDAGSDMTMVLDFDGDKSIQQKGGGNGNGNGNSNKTPSYSMKPVIGIVSVGATQ
jgi:hypothetical protein